MREIGNLARQFEDRRFAIVNRENRRFQPARRTYREQLERGLGAADVGRLVRLSPAIGLRSTVSVADTASRGADLRLPIARLPIADCSIADLDFRFPDLDCRFPIPDCR